MDEWFPKDGKLSKKIYWQMQAYMLYSETSNSIVVFESRESGKIQDYWIRSNQSIQREIYSKYKRAAEIVRSKIFKSRV